MWIQGTHAHTCAHTHAIREHVHSPICMLTHFRGCGGSAIKQDPHFLKTLHETHFFHWGISLETFHLRSNICWKATHLEHMTGEVTPGRASLPVLFNHMPRYFSRGDYTRVYHERAWLLGRWAAESIHLSNGGGIIRPLELWLPPAPRGWP